MVEDEFPWDYSFFEWKDIPVEVRRGWIKTRNVGGRTWTAAAIYRRRVSAGPGCDRG